MRNAIDIVCRNMSGISFEHVGRLFLRSRNSIGSNMVLLCGTEKPNNTYSKLVAILVSEKDA